MNAKKCSRCDKTVYPIEELKCLDKVWHKTCFKCQECNMALNMKNYKGFNKLPYCNAHCPQARATAVADTPESRRLAENTKLQSQVKYHEDFERQKGKVTQVADDPETLRIRNTSKIISNVAYHGELEKKKQMEERRTLMPEEEIKNGFETQTQTQKPQQMPTNAPKSVKTDGNRNARQHQNVSHPQDSANHNLQNSGGNQYHHIQHERLTQQTQQFHTNNVSKDNSPYTAKLQSTVIYTSDQGSVSENARKVGSIADYDPINDNYGSLASGYRTGQNSAFFAGGPHPQVTTNNSSVRPGIGRTFRAMYDYTAQDVDEVSFIDGDMMINCQPIDEGWMTGTVQRTGQTGMLPSNYVEPFN